MDLKIFTSTIAQIAEEKGISSKKVLETIETALAAAYKKEYGERGQIIKAKLNSKTGKAEFWQVKLVVDKKMIYSDEELEKLKEKKTKEEGPEEEKKIRFNPERHIILEDAKKIKSDIKLEEELNLPLESKEDYGRIAAQTAKQVILQKIREAEREAILDEYKSKEGEVISGVVQRIEGSNVFLNIGKTLGILPREEQIPREFYKPGQRLKVYILKIEETSRGPIIFLSRAFPKLISKLFELEVPEISSGQVVIKAIAREPGSRSKIAVASTEEGIDPIGAAVGQKGTRVLVITNELEGEKIDIIEWEEEPEKFIANALSPANVLEVSIEEKNKALVIVPEDQLSLAIGKDGQNVRLAAKLTGWKIDVRSPESEKDKEDEKEIKKQDKKQDKKEKVKKEVKTNKKSKAQSAKSKTV
ncbi:transcription termination/antitermination protein NusA [Candidatus Parcubacteria bacterium]|nr:transcription termination/antitermination protein NusA [Candidatus Parcubacteria bacterium]